MHCKKYERQREEMKQDVDAVITTRELARMIKQAKIDFVNLEDANLMTQWEKQLVQQLFLE